MILFELITHQIPFADRDPLQAAAAAALQHARPLRAMELAPLPARLRALLCSCWAEAPEMRPSFREVTAALAELGARLTCAEQAWLDEPAGHPVHMAAGDDDERGREVIIGVPYSERGSVPAPAAAPYASAADTDGTRDTNPCKVS